MERLGDSHLLRLVQVVTFSAPRSPLTANISCGVRGVRRSVQVQVSRRQHQRGLWSTEDTFLLSLSLTLLLMLVIIALSFICLLLR